jgi:hypothetical protein
MSNVLLKSFYLTKPRQLACDIGRPTRLPDLCGALRHCSLSATSRVRFSTRCHGRTRVSARAKQPAPFTLPAQHSAASHLAATTSASTVRNLAACRDST